MSDRGNHLETSWSRLESIFSEQSKTPPTEYVPPKTPGAPRKPTYRIRRVGLKPRKLIYDFQSYPEGENMTRVRGGEDANRSAALSFNAAFFRLQEDSDEDDDKENHPESVDIVPGTPPSEDHLGSLRNQLNKWVKKILQTVNSTE